MNHPQTPGANPSVTPLSAPRPLLISRHFPLFHEDVAPGTKWISLFSLYLRLMIGTKLLQIGVSEYLAKRGLGMGGGIPGFVFPSDAPDFLSDAGLLACIGVGLALILGFLTRFCCVLVGFLTLVPTVMDVFLALRTGTSPGVNNLFMPVRGINPLQSQEMNETRHYISTLMLILFWTAGVPTNLFSLDGLMFVRKLRAKTPKAASDQPKGPVFTSSTPRRSPLLAGYPDIPVESEPIPYRELDFNDPEFGIVQPKTEVEAKSN